MKATTRDADTRRNAESRDIIARYEERASGRNYLCMYNEINGERITVDERKAGEELKS